MVIPNSSSARHEGQRQYAIYVFREQEYDSLLNAPAPHLSWRRESICPTIEAAMTSAEMVRDQENVKRVQIYELMLDKTGVARTGRIVKTLAEPWWKSVLQSFI